MDHYRDGDDPEKIIMSQMEEYYTANFKEHEVMSTDDFIKTRVWAITFDQFQDNIYIFVGKVKQLSGQKLVQCKIPKQRKQNISVVSFKPEEAQFQ